ncbi:hemerythrin domain-containing protein [uncultured Dechloromonas sp.]|uniref:hemerythrin domain-containing protein n=1 Tax=uncultured Dechloromonas sp. TaxID=171719 RepID=UPI0025F6D8A1|nr:hemerythrin domain-containing protein [uncultured Dechloromonas sp.]
MKRHAALIQHSRDHHHALKLARLARFAADSGLPEAIEEASRTITEQFPRALEPHFQDEEAGLLPRLAAIGQNELVARTLDEHLRLRELNRALLANPGDAAAIAAFAALLHDHVRFEERELFEIAQNLLYPQG